ncbi:hypothetical protein Tcan_04659 [Toxocara canis]|uniref:Uncharacterized protein n=1 Tax=Toxocara canis TaxID=6265 RepID=A0A0B2VRW1_TOXCA|nr:hypothetical protein Tcan_04659 [Toxocara canis]
MNDMLNDTNVLHETPVYDNQNEKSTKQNSNPQCVTQSSLNYVRVGRSELDSDIAPINERLHPFRENVDRNENEVNDYDRLKSMKHKLSIVFEKDENDLDSGEAKMLYNTNGLPSLKEENMTVKLRAGKCSRDTTLPTQAEKDVKSPEQQLRSPAGGTLTAFEEIQIMNMVHPGNGSSDKIPSTPPADFQYCDRLPRKWDEMEVLPNSDSTARLAEIISTRSDEAETANDLFHIAPEVQDLTSRRNTCPSRERPVERSSAKFDYEEKSAREDLKVQESVNYVSSLFPTPRFCPEHLEVVHSPDNAITADEFVIVATPDASLEGIKECGTSSQEQTVGTVQPVVSIKTVPEQVCETCGDAEKPNPAEKVSADTPTISVTPDEENFKDNPPNCMIDSPGSELMQSALSNFPDEFGSCETLEELERFG